MMNTQASLRPRILKEAERLKIYAEGAMLEAKEGDYFWAAQFALEAKASAEVVATLSTQMDQMTDIRTRFRKFLEAFFAEYVGKNFVEEAMRELDERLRDGELVNRLGDLLAQIERSIEQVLNIPDDGAVDK